MSLSVQFEALRTRDLLELLKDENKMNHIISCSEKGVQRATEKILVSNQTLANSTLSQKPSFRDTKLLLSMKYKQQEKLLTLIQAKQEQLAERYTVDFAQLYLQKKIHHAEEECELLFQRFAERKMSLVDFLESFHSSRKLHHIRQVLVKKLQEATQLELEWQTMQRDVQIHPDAEQILHPYHPVWSLPTAAVLPACCHSLASSAPLLPPFLLPFGIQPSQGLTFGFDSNAPVCPRLHRHGAKWPTRPARLKPLLQHRKHHLGPQ